MTQNQQEFYEKLLKKVNEFCLGFAAEEVIAAIDALVDTYETPKVDLTSKPLQALENIIETFMDKDSEDIKTVRTTLKALEIIKKHRLDIDWFLQFVKQDINYKYYVYCVEQSDNEFAKRFLLTKEEYELLKEVLDDVR